MGRLEELLVNGSKKLMEGDRQGAIMFLNQALIIDGKNSSVLSLLGTAYFGNGQFTQAIDYYKSALEITPDETRIRVNLANAYVEIGQIDLAMDEYKLILERDPNNLIARVRLGRCYLKLEQWGDAIREYSEAIKLGVRTKADLGWAYIFTRKRYDRMSQQSERIREESEIRLAYVGLNNAHFRKKEYAKALKYRIMLPLSTLKLMVSYYLSKLELSIEELIHRYAMFKLRRKLH